MSQSAFIEEEAFDEVFSAPVQENKATEKHENSTVVDFKSREPVDIPIDQPMIDDGNNNKTVFNVSNTHTVAFSAKQKTNHKEPPLKPEHQTKPISIAFFPRSLKGIGKKSAPSEAAPKPIIPIAKSTLDVVQLYREMKTEATRHERITIDSGQKAGGIVKMHALKKEHSDDHFQDATTPESKIVKSYDSDVDKQKIKSRIIPTIDTPCFQASVVEGETSAEESIVILTGRIDQDQFPLLESFLNQVIQKSTKRLFCDVGGLSSISSSGWGLLVAEMQRLKKRGGNIFLCGLQGEAEQSYKVLELDKLFLTFRTVSDAMRNTTPEPGNVRPFPKPKGLLTRSEDDPAFLPLEEKIQRIVVENPFLGPGGINKLLRSPTYGKTKIRCWKLISKLRLMNLATKEDRYRFFRSA